MALIPYPERQGIPAARVHAPFESALAGLTAIQEEWVSSQRALAHERVRRSEQHRREVALRHEAKRLAQEKADALNHPREQQLVYASRQAAGERRARHDAVALKEAQEQERRQREFFEIRADSIKASLAGNELDLPAIDELSLDYMRVFGRALTVAKLRREPSLPEAAVADLKGKFNVRHAEEAPLARGTKDRAKTHADWRRSLVPAHRMPETLKAKKVEYQRWVADGRLKPALMREFKKWGQLLQTPLFDPVDLAAVTPDVLHAWRLQDSLARQSNRRAGAVAAAKSSARTRELKKALKLNEYGAGFGLARGLQRHSILCMGPTNSGKTHTAMTALMQARTGMYLAPLRLLALEAYERLRAQGLAVSLLTGEERIIERDATHICATVEMCDFDHLVDVAVVDEVQLIGDAQRGWAWTAALLGVAAKTVYACGADYAQASVIGLMGSMGDTVEVSKHERKTPLVIMERPISLEHIEAGDALIAFSRREVLQFAYALQSRGLATSVIYGALSPEVRKAQVQAFTSGQTQVVVATDAIGMGINLPIRRVIFTGACKFDGIAMRWLTPAQVQQIAGRAGRFGHHAQGFVGAFGGTDLEHIRRALLQRVVPLQGPAPVMPTWVHVRVALEKLSLTQPRNSSSNVDAGAPRVTDALEFLDRISFGGGFVKAELAPIREKAQFAQQRGRGALSPWAVFRLACAPAELTRDEDRTLLEEAIWALARTEMLSKPRCPVALDTMAPDPHELELAENHSRELALYAWLGCTFAGLTSTEGLAEERQFLAEFINRGLQAQAGAMLVKRRRRYKWGTSSLG